MDRKYDMWYSKSLCFIPYLNYLNWLFCKQHFCGLILIHFTRSLGVIPDNGQ